MVIIAWDAGVSWWKVDVVSGKRKWTKKAPGDNENSTEMS